MSDPVNHPSHYGAHPSGVKCIEITEHMGFNLGNAVKYIWRCDLKGDAIEDLRKAAWYIEREIARREASTEMVEIRDHAGKVVRRYAEGGPVRQPGPRDLQ